MVWGLRWLLPNRLKVYFVRGLTFCPGIDWVFLVMLHILPLAEHLAEVPRPSFIGLRPPSHLCCGLWNSAMSLFNLRAGLLQPRLPGAAFNSVCVSVGQKITPTAKVHTTWGGLVHTSKRLCVCFCLHFYRTSCWSSCVTWWRTSDLCPSGPPPSL